MRHLNPSTTSHSTPTLPTELVEEILRNEDLLKRDLSRCCLVSKQFLPSARKSLYANLNFRYQGDDPSEEPDAFPEASTSLIVRALASNPQLQRIPSSISFYYQVIDGYHSRSVPSIDRDEVLTQVLKLTPNLKHLELDRHFSIPRRVEASGIFNMETITSMDIDDLDEIGVEVLGHIRNLKKLRVETCQISSNTQQSDPFLPNLTALEVRRACLTSPSSLSRRLSVLHLPLQITPVDYNLFRHLEHLHLAIRPSLLDSASFPNLEGLRCLKTLYLEDFSTLTPNPDQVEENWLTQLLAISPPNPICLAFTAVIPYPYLLDYLDSSATFPIHQIRLSPRRLSDPEHFTPLEALCLCCERQGIALSFDLILPVNIFRL